MASRLQDVVQRDTRALQPLATAVAPGTWYYVTDEFVTERSDGTNWEDCTDGGGVGTGDVVGPASSVDDRITTFDGITGKLIQDGGQTIAQVLTAALAAAIAAIVPVDLAADVTGVLPAANIDANIRIRSIGVTLDGGGVAITTGIKADISVPYACTIVSVVMLADQAGTIVVDIWKDTYANYPPINADSITAAAPPTVTSPALKSEDTTLTGWTLAIAAGDTLRFNVDSNTVVERLALVLKVQI